MSTHNINFYEDLTKIIFQLSSNMHLISSSVIGSTNSTGRTNGINLVSVLDVKQGVEWRSG